jgi:hypothetical protein
VVTDESRRPVYQRMYISIRYEPTAVSGPACAGFGYISPEPARLNGNTFLAISLPSAAARRCADHASSARPASAQIIQHRLGDFEAHAEALQPCREGPAQVMQPPAGQFGCNVERRLGFRLTAEGRSALAGEDERQFRPPVLQCALDTFWPIGAEAVEEFALLGGFVRWPLVHHAVALLIWKPDVLTAQIVGIFVGISAFRIEIIL